MPTGKRRKTAARAARRRAKSQATPTDRLRQGWEAALRRLASAERDMEKRVKTLQSRLSKERKSAGRAVQEAVQSALAALNIPSRAEIAELTRRVEALSRKLDARKADARKR